VRTGGYIDEALSDASRRLDTASRALDRLPNGEARSILETLGSYLLNRVEAARPA
jgi:hypothetical protein